MKFGKQYDFHKIPEWSENYLDYEYLKSLLKEISKQFKEGKYPRLNKVNKLRKHRSTSDLGNIISDMKVVGNNVGTNFQEALIHELPPNRSHSTMVKIEGSINIMSDRIEAKVSDDLQNNRNSEEVVDFELEQFHRDYVEKLKTVEEFFKTKLGDLFSEFDKLRKKMSTKKQTVCLL
jgi:hypothetical protein